MRYHLVDKITYIEKDKKITGIKNFSYGEGFPVAFFNSRPILPRIIVIESVLQLGSYLLAYSTNFKYLPLVAKMDRIDILDDFKWGNQLVMEVVIKSLHNDSGVATGKGWINDKLVISSENILFVFMELEKLVEPEEFISDYQILTGYKIKRISDYL